MFVGVGVGVGVNVAWVVGVGVGVRVGVAVGAAVRVGVAVANTVGVWVGVGAGAAFLALMAMLSVENRARNEVRSLLAGDISMLIEAWQARLSRTPRARTNSRERVPYLWSVAGVWSCIIPARCILLCMSRKAAVSIRRILLYAASSARVPIVSR